MSEEPKFYSGGSQFIIIPLHFIIPSTRAILQNSGVITLKYADKRIQGQLKMFQSPGSTGQNYTTANKIAPLLII